MKNIHDDLTTIQSIQAIPTMLRVICSITGMGFAAVARVTENNWLACEVLDKINFGLKSGGELKLDTTICDYIRQSQKPVVIDDVANDPDYHDHPTPAMYGFRSYISMPILLSGDRFFGTLCAIDPKPAKVKNDQIIGMFKLFAELIAFHLEAHEKLSISADMLNEEQKTSHLREQFIAVLGHDLRNPLGAISAAADLLNRKPSKERADELIELVKTSSDRMQQLIDNILDFARGRLGDGLTLNQKVEDDIMPVLQQVISELKAKNPERKLHVTAELDEPINCDSVRLSQMFSNVLGNAYTYGTVDAPIKIEISSADGIFELSVENKGPRIPEDALPRLFEPFARGDQMSNRQGLGLGLYIASQIAGAHKGALSVSSTDERTRFSFRMASCGNDARQSVTSAI